MGLMKELQGGLSWWNAMINEIIKCKIKMNTLIENQNNTIKP